MILLAVCLEQDLGKERVEERETGVMIKDVEALLEEVEAMSMKFSLSVKTRTKRKQKANLYHTILGKKRAKVDYKLVLL